jgi:uncharacterized lipoprotein
MSKTLFRFPAIIIMALSLGACSWFKEKPPEYMAGVEVPLLEVPEGLDPLQYPAPLLISTGKIRLPSGDELNPGPPRAVTTAGQGNNNAYLAWSGQGVYLAVADTPESVQRRLGFAIQRIGMVPLATDKPLEHRFEYVQPNTDDRSFWQKLAFWSRSDTPDYSGFYFTRVEADAEGSRVYLFLDSGTPATTTAAEHILGIFMERLG